MIGRQEITFIDFCSGIGASRLGLEMLGLKCLAHSEIDPDSEKVYQSFYSDTNNLGDLTKIPLDRIPKVDILITGFPCQTFSIIGKRKGLKDERGQIIYYLSKILKYRSIPYFIFENVKGLSNHQKGETLKNIVKLLNESGYEVFYKILNSIDFGVPQSRERIYFVGIRKDLCNKPFVFPNPQKSVDIKNFLLSSNDNVQEINHPSFQRYLNNKYNKNRINMDEILKKDFCILDTRQSDLRIYEDRCPTLRTARHGILYVKNKKLYKLQGLEALMLQGFSKQYILKAKEMNFNNNKLLSQAGNAMTVSVVYEIGKSLLNYMKDK